MLDSAATGFRLCIFTIQVTRGYLFWSLRILLVPFLSLHKTCGPYEGDCIVNYAYEEYRRENSNLYCVLLCCRPQEPISLQG